METVSTGVLEKNKEHYLRNKDEAEKWYHVKKIQKGRPTCRRLVVNPRHQTPQGQSVAKPETPLQNIQVEYLDVT